MAWAIPCAVGFIPPDDAAHMAADRRECMHDSLFVPEGSHAFAVDLQDRRLAATNRVERFRLWLYMPASARSRAPVASSADFGPAAGLMRVASNISSQRFSLPLRGRAGLVAAAVPLLMPHAPKPVATRYLSPLDDDQPTNGAQSVELQSSLTHR